MENLSVDGLLNATTNNNTGGYIAYITGSKVLLDNCSIFTSIIGGVHVGGIIAYASTTSILATGINIYTKASMEIEGAMYVSALMAFGDIQVTLIATTIFCNASIIGPAGNPPLYTGGLVA
jgi:hypothetical protein